MYKMLFTSYKNKLNRLNQQMRPFLGNLLILSILEQGVIPVKKSIRKNDIQLMHKNEQKLFDDLFTKMWLPPADLIQHTE